MQDILLDKGNYPFTALLIKKNALKFNELNTYYGNFVASSLLCYPLEAPSKGAPTAKLMQEYMSYLLPELKNNAITTLYVADGAYFKYLTKVGKLDPCYGSVMKCRIKGYEDLNVILGVNYQVLFFNPNVQQRLTLSVNTLSTYLDTGVTEIGANVIHNARFPTEVQEIKEVLEILLEYPALTCDIENYALDLGKGGIATISFAIDQHNGVAFPVDWFPENKEEVRSALVEFFTNYTGKVIYHRGNYDIKHLIFNLFMDRPLDIVGMVEGLHIMCRDIEDTKLIAYLATNNAVENILSLKYLAHEFTGDYAQEDIKDITKIHLDKLLKYNLTDSLATWYVYNKYLPIMKQDSQEEFYETLFKPSLKNVIHMELVGMPLNSITVNKLSGTLAAITKKESKELLKLPLIEKFLWKEQQAKFRTRMSELKKKVISIDDCLVEFNPNSSKQVARLLFDFFKLKVTHKTKKNAPSTNKKALNYLYNSLKNLEGNFPNKEEILSIVKCLLNISEVANLQSTFISAFQNKVLLKEDGKSYLHGSFNLGGTVSGRMSSSDPNIQNLPSSGTRFAKGFKECFEAPEGWVIVGLDFNSLEDKISALTTKDPNKMAVYLQGYNGHCLRAYAYFSDQMPDIDPSSVVSINSIEDKYPDLRQLSKAPTFALTYQGTKYTLMLDLGFSDEMASKIEINYHELYKVSDEWVQAKLQEACNRGYVEAAFGLRLRTPTLAKTILNRRTTPSEAEAEGRTAGNALGQSWGLLNNRSANEFMEKVYASGYRYSILPMAHVHDSQYYLVRKDLALLAWMNKELIDSMQWQEHPDIQHDKVKLEAELELFYPNMSQSVKIPNNATIQEIEELFRDKLSLSVLEQFK